MKFCDKSNQDVYPFILPKLPFEKDAFAPHFSTETFDYHHGLHHNGYVTKLNQLLENNKEMLGLDLEQIIKISQNTNQAIFNNASQIWNHSFFWHSIKPDTGGEPEDGALATKIIEDFGSYENFSNEFQQAAIAQFGSGWVWLVLNKENKLEIIKTSNAETPITQDLYPILTCDVWEHAYYIDYRNKRPKYVQIFLDNMLNWEFASMNLHRALQ